jgi:hypothetical protein
MTKMQLLDHIDRTKNKLDELREQVHAAGKDDTIPQATITAIGKEVDQIAWFLLNTEAAT